MIWLIFIFIWKRAYKTLDNSPYCYSNWMCHNNSSKLNLLLSYKDISKYIKNSSHTYAFVSNIALNIFYLILIVRTISLCYYEMLRFIYYDISSHKYCKKFKIDLKIFSNNKMKKMGIWLWCYLFILLSLHHYFV